jgi:putative phage-type endonuclease
MEQRSEAWFAARLGKVTASKISDIIGKTQSGYSASRANYMALLVCERLTGAAAESYSNAAMQHGTDTEPMALSAYEAAQGVLVQAEGFVTHPFIEQSGASPDGLVGNSGLIEIKCPNTATHLDTLLAKKMPSKHRAQVQWQMACTGTLWCDFVSYDPRMPEHLAIWVKRVPRDDAMIEELESAVRVFLAEVASTVAALEAYAEAA